MEEKVEHGLTKVESLIQPVSAGVVFFKNDIPLLLSGDWNGLISSEVGYLKAWHPPTLMGIGNMLRGPLGEGALVALAGWAVEEVGRTMGSGMVSRVGKDLKHGGQGTMLGGLADGLVRPTKYNPGAGGAAGLGGHDPIMLDPMSYEVTSKAHDSVSLMAR